MMSFTISCNAANSSLDPEALSFADPEVAAEVLRFHQSLPGYQPTPLVSLPALADRLGIERLLVKDESRRFGLNAFKPLGASYAMARSLAEKVGLGARQLTYESLVAAIDEIEPQTFVTATDGNHGRAVAWAAELFGCQAEVFMPAGSSEVRLEAIRGHGAEASIIERNYDQAVHHAERVASEKGGILLQDTAWQGYEVIPRRIMQGYLTILSEFREQAPEDWPTHIFVQAGVGSFAAAMLGFVCNCAGKNPKPVFVVVEPTEAACLQHSLEHGDGQPHGIDGDLPTIMAGLACGQPSLLAWQALSAGADAFAACRDEVAKQGMRIYGNPAGHDPRIVSGESGAVTLGLLKDILAGQGSNEAKRQLRLDRSAKVLLISSEGDTDPEFYRHVVWSCH